MRRSAGQRTPWRSKAFATLGALLLAACSAFSGTSSGDDSDVPADATADESAQKTADGAGSVDTDANPFESDAEKSLPEGGAMPDVATHPTDASFDANLNGTRYVFVTSATYYPGKDFNTVADADNLCMAAAAAGIPALQGLAFRAWLSTTTYQPKDAFVHGQASYMTTAGEQIATSFDGLLNNGAPENALASDEAGKPAAGSVWTATNMHGATLVQAGKEGADSCTNWTGEAAAMSGYYGTVGALNSSWTDTNSLPCDMPGHFYCFQQ